MGLFYAPIPLPQWNCRNGIGGGNVKESPTLAKELGQIVFHLPMKNNREPDEEEPQLRHFSAEKQGVMASNSKQARFL